MATPTSNAYSCESGGTIAAGRYVWPAWRQAMAPGTWALVPGNTLADINPANSAAINPNHPSAAPWAGSTGHAAVVSAWCGACWDDETGTFWIPLSGGHNDYFGNEPYKNCLFVDTPAWEMLRNPTGAIGNTGGVFNDGLEYTGVNWDGRFRACHSYNKPVYVPGRGPMMTILGSNSPNPSGPNYTLLLDEATGEMTNVATNSAASGVDGGAAYDPSRNRLYWLGSSGARLTHLNCDTWAWTTLSGGTFHNEYSNQSLVYVPGKDVLVNLGAGTGVLSVFSPVTGTRYQPGTTGTGGATLSGSGGAKWCQSLGCILYWHNSTSTTLITTITPPANPLTEPWVLGTLSVDPSNSVTPTARNSNGTYGRFQVSEKLRAALLLNATNQQIYAFALD